jgi:hypothetical protein
LSMARLAVSMLESGARRMKWAAGSCWFGQGRIEANRQLVRWQKIRMSVGWKSRRRWPGQSRYLIRNWVKNLTKMHKYCNFYLIIIRIIGICIRILLIYKLLCI